MSERISRRDFLRLAAVGLGAAAGGRLLAACSPATVPATTPTHGLVPTAAASLRRPEIIKMHPTAPSRVVHTQHAGVWAGDSLQPEALKQMLDVSITKLTGLTDALAAWQALFAPTERIAIKVNTLQYGLFWTHVPLVMGVVERLQAAGVPPEQVVIYDRASSDLTGGGFTLNRDGPGVRCYGTDGAYTRQWELLGTTVGLSDVLLSCDALIDMPILKTHIVDGGGISFALKNHYGTFDQPSNFHNERMLTGLPALNALAPIKERTRLIVGDALKVVQQNAYQTFDGDSICMSFDPVAHDMLGLQILTALQAANDMESEAIRKPAITWLQNAADMGVGTNLPDKIELIEEKLA
jgi:uncharacterized protein (DUF362 family)